MLEATAQAPILVDDHVNLPRLRVHDDGAGAVAKGVERRAADGEVFAVRLVLERLVGGAAAGDGERDLAKEMKTATVALLPETSRRIAPCCIRVR